MNAEQHVPQFRFKDFSDSWVQCNLGDLAEIVRGASPRPIQDPKWFDDSSEIGWLRISDVTEQNGRIHHLDQHISEAGQAKTRVLTEPHLLLSIAATVGKPLVNYVKTGVHDGFLIFMNPKFDLEFMFQWLESYRDKWSRYGQPGSQVNLNSDLVKNQSISIPSMDEQQKLGEFFTSIDNLIAANQRKLDLLKEQKKGYLQKMFPKNGAKVPELRFAGFADAWEQRKLGEVAEFSKGNGYTKEDLTENGSPIILYGRLYTKYKAVINDVDTFVVPKDRSVISKGNEVIVPASGETAEDISRASVVGKSGFILGGDLNVIKPDILIDSLFLALTISNGSQQKEMAKRAQGKSVVHLHSSDLQQINLLYPKLKEQRKIDTFFKQLDDTITLHQRKLDLLKEQKKGYLQKMFAK